MGKAASGDGGAEMFDGSTVAEEVVEGRGKGGLCGLRGLRGHRCGLLSALVVPPLGWYFLVQSIRSMQVISGLPARVRRVPLKRPYKIRFS